jgi:acetolactate synthase-1/2/3 large subunit
MMRVADYIMDVLHSNGVSHIYTVTGRGALFLTDAVAKHKSLCYICTHHEQAASYAAVGYAQYSGRIGACLVSTGCAVTNTLSGVLSAWQDGISCVFISGQNMLQETSAYTGINLRTYGQQEANIIPIVQSITKYAVMITDPTRIVYEIEKALYLSQQGRNGPVWIDVPLDIQSALIEPSELEHFYPPVLGVNELKLNQGVGEILSALACSERPAILIGGGVHASDSISEFEQFIEKFKIPVTYASSAVDTYGSGNPLSIGSVGSMGCTRAGNFVVQNCDFLLVLGSRLTSMTTGVEYCKFARDAKIIVVDIDMVEHSKKSIRIDHFINEDIKTVLNKLLISDVKKTNDVWLGKCMHWKSLFSKIENPSPTLDKVDLYQLAESLSSLMPKKSTVVTDSGLIELILPTNMIFEKGQRCIHPVSQGAMGFAIPAAIGVFNASGLPTVVVVGDGSIMMNLQELQTIKTNNIPLKIIVVNNNAYAIIRKRQKDLFRKRTMGTDKSNGVECPDFEMVADCFGIPFVKIENKKNLSEILESVIAMDGPVLCEVFGLEDQDYIEISQARNLEGRLVRRPLEDQSPFLDRSIFLSEMIVKPIDQ